MQDGVQSVPEIVPPDGVEIAEEVYLFAKQHGARVDAWRRAGVDLVAVLGAAASNATRSTQWRLERKAKAIAAAGAVNVTEQVLRMLRPVDAAITP
jgi:hypothetical protein